MFLSNAVKGARSEISYLCGLDCNYKHNVLFWEEMRGKTVQSTAPLSSSLFILLMIHQIDLSWRMKGKIVRRTILHLVGTKSKVADSSMCNKNTTFFLAFHYRFYSIFNQTDGEHKLSPTADFVCLSHFPHSAVRELSLKSNTEGSCQLYSTASVTQSTSVNRLHILFLKIDRKQMLMSFFLPDIRYHFWDTVYDEFGMNQTPVLWLCWFFSTCVPQFVKAHL